MDRHCPTDGFSQVRNGIERRLSIDRSENGSLNIRVKKVRRRDLEKDRDSWQPAARPGVVVMNGSCNLMAS